jgi:hypothetical protein
MIRNCVICESEFKCSPSDKKVTCSTGCRSERARRAKTAKGRSWNTESKSQLSAKGQTENLKSGTPAAKQSPKSGSFETNVNAKNWILVDPTGKEHRVRNLRLWCKNNAAGIFGREPDQVRLGFSQVKRSMQGKRLKSPVMHYMEWSLKDTWSQGR